MAEGDIQTGTAVAEPTTSTPVTGSATILTPETPGVDAAPDGTPNGEQAPKKEDAAKTEGAPEAYADFKFPEKDYEVDTALVDKFKVFSKEKNWSQETAQSVIDFQANVLEPMAQERQAKAFEAMTQKWSQDARADKEIGGSKFEENIALAMKPIAKYGSQELKDALNWSGLGNNVAVIKFLAQVGKTMSDSDVIVNGTQGAVNKPSLADRLFTSMK